MSGPESTAEGRGIVIAAIESLMRTLEKSPTRLDGATLDLLGIDGNFVDDFETQKLFDVGTAFLDLLAGRLTCTVESTEFMPGSR